MKLLVRGSAVVLLTCVALGLVACVSADRPPVPAGAMKGYFAGASVESIQFGEGPVYSTYIVSWSDVPNDPARRQRFLLTDSTTLVIGGKEISEGGAQDKERALEEFSTHLYGPTMSTVSVEASVSAPVDQSIEPSKPFKVVRYLSVGD